MDMLPSFREFVSRVGNGDTYWQTDMSAARSKINSLMQECMHQYLEGEALKEVVVMYKAAGKVLADVSILAEGFSSSTWPVDGESLWRAMSMDVLNCLLPRPYCAPDIQFEVDQQEVSVHVRLWGRSGANVGEMAALPPELTGWQILLRNDPREQKRFLVWRAHEQLPPPSFYNDGDPSAQPREYQAAFASDIRYGYFQFRKVSYDLWEDIVENHVIHYLLYGMLASRDVQRVWGVLADRLQHLCEAGRRYCGRKAEQKDEASRWIQERLQNTVMCGVRDHRGSVHASVTEHVEGA